MAYIGTDINYGNIASQTGVGDGTTTPSTVNPLTYSVPTSSSIMVTLDGVTQVPGTDYTATGTTLTFTSSVASPIAILVYFLGRSLDIGTPADNTVTNAKMANNAIDSAELVAGSVDDAHLATGITASKLSGIVPTANLGTGTASSTTILYGDGTYKAEPVTADEITTQATAPTVSNPATPTQGDLILATTTQQLYCCKTVSVGANVWVNIGDGTGGVSPTYTLDYLVIAGGGSGGCMGGGGGAGGYRNSYNGEMSGGGNSGGESAFVATIGASYTVTIGEGGTGNTDQTTKGDDGGDSVFGTITATKGGGGGGKAASSGDANANGKIGGSGGGGGYMDVASGTAASGGAGTTDQGFAGGIGWTSYHYGGGGGGGASVVGTAGTHSTGGAGGAGLASAITTTGSTVTRAGGGGGGGDATFGAGGAGGGGDGQTGTGDGAAGTVNTGSGGGNAQQAAYTSGNGGSGVVILRIPDANYSGTTTGSPTVDTSTIADETILIFNGDGSYTA